MPQSPKPNFFLHCDACHHEVDFEGKLTRAHIGHPCPVCQESMLTERDYKLGRRVQFMLSVLSFFGLVRPMSDDPKARGVPVRLHGHNGRINVRKL